MERKLYSELAQTIQWRKGLPEGHHAIDMADDKLKLLTDLLPHGSGWDHGTTLDLEASHANKIVMYGSFHHMNENGMYDGWTEHTVVVTPSLTSGIDIRISGRNRNDIKDYLQETFHFALVEDVTYELFAPHFPDLRITSKWEDKEGNPSQCYQAFYVQGSRYWNDFQSAKTHAAKLMEDAWFNRR